MGARRTRQQKIETSDRMEDIQQITIAAVRTLIRNVRRVAVARNILIDELPPAQWEGITAARLGTDQLLRVVLFVALVMSRNGILLHEVLCEDPELLQQAMAIGDMMLYYQQYPAAAGGAGAGAPIV